MLLFATDSVHAILRTLYYEMMPLCGRLTGVATAVAGIGALLYISYRVWQSIARAEPIDLFGLLRPFAIGICIMFFPTLVIGSISGILSPIVTGAHELMQSQVMDMKEHQKKKDDSQLFVWNPFGVPPIQIKEKEKEISEMNWSPKDGEIMNNLRNIIQRFSLEGIVTWIMRQILELIFSAASLVIDTLRVFYLIVLSILGPLAFAVSVFDGFGVTLVQWIARYVCVYLWLPVSDIFSAIIARIQVLSLQHDMTQGQWTLPDSSDFVYLVLLLVGIIGYFCVPSIASWVIQAGGLGAYNRKVSGLVSVVGGAVGGAIGNSLGRMAGNGKK